MKYNGTWNNMERFQRSLEDCAHGAAPDVSVGSYWRIWRKGQKMPKEWNIMKHLQHCSYHLTGYRSQLIAPKICQSRTHMTHPKCFFWGRQFGPISISMPSSLICSRHHSRSVEEDFNRALARGLPPTVVNPTVFSMESDWGVLLTKLRNHSTKWRKCAAMDFHN